SSPHVLSHAATQAVTVGDFNDDGSDDVASLGNGTIQIFLGNDDGTFNLPSSIAAGSGATAIDVGDFNGDYVDDIAVAVDGGVNVLVGNSDSDGYADGTFAAPTFVPTGGTPSAIAVNYFGNYDDANIVATGPSGTTFLQNNGSGG